MPSETLFYNKKSLNLAKIFGNASTLARKPWFTIYIIIPTYCSQKSLPFVECNLYIIFSPDPATWGNAKVLPKVHLNSKKKVYTFSNIVHRYVPTLAKKITNYLRSKLPRIGSIEDKNGPIFLCICISIWNILLF